MREVTDHRTGNLINDLLIVESYELQPKYAIGIKREGVFHCISTLNFHQGLPSDGVNGLTNEVLLAIVIDRLRVFQNGITNCRENALVITKLEEALHWLGHRTRDRLNRGVEGQVAR